MNALRKSDVTEAREIPDWGAFVKAMEKLEITKESLVMTMAEHWTQQGIQKGIEQGMAQGMQSGIEQGMRAVARRMIERNRPLVEIMEDTGLSEAEVRALKTTRHKINSIV